MTARGLTLFVCLCLLAAPAAARDERGPDPRLPSPAADWMGQGNLAGAGLGRSVAAAGDVNGDGYDDVIVGAPTVAIPRSSKAGRWCTTAARPGSARSRRGRRRAITPTATWAGRWGRRAT